MIRVIKSAAAPASLARQAAAACQALEDAYDANPAGCQLPGTRALKARRVIYAARDVKARLIADQHGKCAYCETLFLHSSPGDVEHYRPKAGFRQAATSPVEGPGYYWLAYDWANLLFACEDCNRIRKRQLFPLRNDPAGRARNHHDVFAQEAPLLLNPASGPDPETQITFVEEAAKGLTPEGEASIIGYDLNRAELLDDRRQRLQGLQRDEFLGNLFAYDPPVVDLERLIQAYGSEEMLGWHIAQATKALAHATTDAAEYAGMARAYRRQHQVP
jgi:uncharacterized protein (TIGR02646 family)